MPLGYFDRLPIPNLTTYTVISIAFFISVVYNAVQVTKDPSWKNNAFPNERNASEIIVDDEHLIDLDNLNLPDHVKDILIYMIQENISRWVFINTITCVISLFGKILQKLVFGDLRTVEIINFREKLCNYFLYKFIFMFGVIKVQTAEDVILLLGWFGILGFLQIFVQFSKDRLEYMVTVSSNVIFWNRCKIVMLLLCLFSIAVYMIHLCIIYGVNLGYNIFAFMVAECLSITLRVPHSLIKYVIDPFEANFMRSQNQRFGGPNSFANFIINKMEMSLTYYLLLCLELADLCLELLHYLHMLLWGNIFFSVVSLGICLHLRYLMTEIQRKIKKHRNYVWILNHMEKEYPIASEKELNENSDNCAICWEKMELARKLPCGHLFHSACLQLWLEQDTSCPTCRYVLNINGTNARRSTSTRQTPGLIRIGGNPAAINHQHFFHFDGSRYVSWLPSFSVQVMSTVGTPDITDSQFESMARQVQQIFPHYPPDVIIENLRQTRSVNVTIDNILDGIIRFENDRLDVLDESVHISRTNSNSEQSQSSSSNNNNNNSNSNNNNNNNSSIGNNSISDQVPVDNELNELDSSRGTDIPDNEFSTTQAERELALRNRKDKLFFNAKNKYLKRLVN